MEETFEDESSAEEERKKENRVWEEEEKGKRKKEEGPLCSGWLKGVGQPGQQTVRGAWEETRQQEVSGKSLTGDEQGAVDGEVRI